VLRTLPGWPRRRLGLPGDEWAGSMLTGTIRARKRTRAAFPVNYNDAVILAGDVGGTKTILGLFRAVGGELRVAREETFPSQEYPSLEGIVEAFLSRGKRNIEALAVGVAGPVVDGRSHVVNLRWPVDQRRLGRQLEIDRVSVLNDLEATAWGISELPSRKMLSLTPGLRARTGNAALIAAGTGLGMALLLWDGERHHASASEGGHQDFGPRDDLEIALLRYLRRRHGRVSTERLVSGAGFSAIYDFLTDNGWGSPSAEMSRKLGQAEDPNAVISEAGLRGEDPLAEKTLEMFVSIYGAAAGDLALVAKATAGVYVGGGIAPKILPRLKSGEFVRAFRDKGRLTPLLEKVPVRVILEPRTALLGAAAYAARQAASPRRRTPKRG
jgi:glucokinase